MWNIWNKARISMKYSEILWPASANWNCNSLPGQDHIPAYNTCTIVLNEDHRSFLCLGALVGVCRRWRERDALWMRCWYAWLSAETRCVCIQSPVYVMHWTHARQSTSNLSFSHNQVTPCGDLRYDAAPGYVRGPMERLPLSTLAMSYHPVVCHSPNTLAHRNTRAVRGQN